MPAVLFLAGQQQSRSRPEAKPLRFAKPQRFLKRLAMSYPEFTAILTESNAKPAELTMADLSGGRSRIFN